MNSQKDMNYELGPNNNWKHARKKVRVKDSRDVYQKT
jgi:hypothetical protein